MSNPSQQQQQQQQQQRRTHRGGGGGAGSAPQGGNRGGRGTGHRTTSGNAPVTRHASQQPRTATTGSRHAISAPLLAPDTNPEGRNASPRAHHQQQHQQYQQQQQQQEQHQQRRQQPLPYLQRRNELERPAFALAEGIMEIYRNINNKYYRERRTDGYDDADGHYVSIVGESIGGRYTVKGILGKGSFGTVLHCLDEKHNEDVALKVIRSGNYFKALGHMEMEMLYYLNGMEELQNLVMQLRTAFTWQGHPVLVFELLSFNLFELIKCTQYNGVSLDLARKFAYQLLRVLVQLDRHHPPIIHSDLKPENVVLKDRRRSGIRVIDFGSACYQQVRQWTMPPPRIPLGKSRPTMMISSPVTSGSHSSKDASRAVVNDAMHNAKPGANPGNDGERGQQAEETPAASPGSAMAAAGTHASAALPTATPAHPDASVSKQRAATAARGEQPPPLFPSEPTTSQQVQAQEQAAPLYRNPAYDVMPKYIQSRFYRSPEVILELGYTTAIDRWSVGCMLVELHTGVPLFPGLNEVEMIGYFTAILGPLPDEMIAASPKFHLFYVDTRVEKVPWREETTEGDKETRGMAGGAGGGGVFSNEDWEELALPPLQDGLVGTSHVGMEGSDKTLKKPLVAKQPQLQQQQYDERRPRTAAADATAAPLERRTSTAIPPSSSAWETHDGASPPPLPSPSTVSAGASVSRTRRPPLTSTNANDLRSATESAVRHTALSPPPAPTSVEAVPSSDDASAVGTPPPPSSSSHVQASALAPHRSPFVLRHPPKEGIARSLADIIGVYTGGPRGCRRGQQYHDVDHYLIFLDFVQGLLAYDPRQRLSCDAALNHPFLAPLRELERQAAAAQAAAAAAAAGMASPSAATGAPPPTPAEQARPEASPK